MKVTSKARGRQFLAALGAAALGLVGLAGFAYADDPPSPQLSVANINPEAKGKIWIDKFVTPNPAWETTNNGKQIAVPSDAERLGGITFEIVRVKSIGKGTGAVPLDLTTPAGWDAAATLNAANVDADRHGNTGGYDFDAAQNVITSADGAVASSELPVGLYLVHETAAGNNPVTGPTPPSLVSIPYPDTANTEWLYDVYLYPKNDVSDKEVTKEVKDPPQVVLPDGAIVQTDATVEWVIRVPLFHLADETYKKFEVVDTMNPNLQYVAGSATVKSFRGEIGNGVPQGTFGESGDFTVTPLDAPKNGITIAATDAGLAKLNAGKDQINYIEITIKTKVLGAGILENDAAATVNDWKSTVENKPTTNWATLEILKYGGTNQSNTLKGAEFNIFKDRGEDGNGIGQVGSTYVTGADGKITVTLWVGNNADVTQSYWIQETKAPAGYTLPAGDAAWKKVNLTATTGATVLTEPMRNTQHGGPQLPITGASGQLLMMLGGVALVLAGGGAAIVASRKRHQ